MKLEEKTIEELSAISFLERGTLPFSVETVLKLEEAEQSINGLEWENLCLDERGNVTVFLAIHHKTAYNTYWNQLVAETKECIIPLLEQKLDKLVEEGKLLEEMKPQILFDLVNLSVCKSYASLYHSSFYERLFQVYQAGFIPCGWLGNYPQGKMKVF